MPDSNERYVWHLSSDRFLDARITRQRVVKETDARILLHGPRWGWHHDCDWECMNKSECHESFDAAKSTLIGRREDRIVAAEDALHRARTALGNAKSMKEPDHA